MTGDRLPNEERDGFERALGVSLPKRTLLDRTLVGFIALATYPAWLIPETLRLWTAAKRATSWRRIYFIIDRATEWPARYWGIFLIAIPLLLLLGWINRLLAPPLR
ncbi:hypothetical protein [Ferrovibrio terrae]|uniref:hypothetical protein n=1 Tax=Ferrovibrio terrae TaxID=2594003 RepID=UPI003137D9F6